MSSVNTVQVVSESISGSRRTIRFLFRLLDNQANEEAVERELITTDKSTPAIDLGTPLAVSHLSALATQEENAAESDYSNDRNALDLVQFPRWTSQKAKAKRLLLWMLRVRDPRIVLWMAPFLLWLRANYTGQQIANWLEIPLSVVIKANNRINTLLDAPTVAKSCQELIDEFDANEVDYED